MGTLDALISQQGDRYAGERTWPSVDLCKDVDALIFDGRFLTMRMPGGNAAFPAVSGAALSEVIGAVVRVTNKIPPNTINVDGKLFNYSRERQKIKDQGPIPAGMYWIDPSQLVKNTERWYGSDRFNRRSWGNWRITIHPYPFTPVWQRGGFFIHGGDEPGSIGCIDLWVRMDSFVSRLQTAMGASDPDDLPECYIPLSVRY
jgi:hypothetical protein